MKRTDRMVGIDGTAHGRMKITDSDLDPPARLHEEARQHQRDHHLHVDGDDQEDERVDDRAEEDRVVEQVHVARRVARQPEAVADRVEHEDEEHEQVGRRASRAPELPRDAAAAAAGGRRRRRRVRRSVVMAVSALAAEDCQPCGPSPCRSQRYQPATALMRAIISSTALSTGTFSLSDAVHRLGPDVLVVQHRELVVLREFERHRAGRELVVDRQAMRIGLPERALLRRLGHREPAAQRTFDIRRQVFLLQAGRRRTSCAAALFLASLNTTPVFTAAR